MDTLYRQISRKLTSHLWSVNVIEALLSTLVPLAELCMFSTKYLQLVLTAVLSYTEYAVPSWPSTSSECCSTYGWVERIFLGVVWLVRLLVHQGPPFLLYHQGSLKRIITAPIDICTYNIYVVIYSLHLVYSFFTNHFIKQNGLSLEQKICNVTN